MGIINKIFGTTVTTAEEAQEEGRKKAIKTQILATRTALEAQEEARRMTVRAMAGAVDGKEHIGYSGSAGMAKSPSKYKGLRPTRLPARMMKDEIIVSLDEDKEREDKERAKRIWTEEFSQDPLGALATRLGYHETDCTGGVGRHFYPDHKEDNDESE